MKHVAFVLVVALIASLAHVPSVQAAPTDNEPSGAQMVLNGIVAAGILYGVYWLIDNWIEGRKDARVDRYLEANPDTPESIAELMRNGTIAIGMTAEQLEATWGKPQRINDTITAGGTREQWVYARDYVYVTNGRITSIQSR